MARLIAGLAALSALLAGPAFAQQTRAEALEAERAARASRIEPYRSNKVEQGLLYIEDHRILERLAAGFEGIYPRIGGFTTGSGLALGAGYQRSSADDRIWMDTSIAWSTKQYKIVEITGGSRRLGADWLSADGGLTWRDMPQEDFWGIGDGSAASARTAYRLRDTRIDAGITARPFEWLSAGQRVGLLSADLGRGHDQRFPSTETRFTDSAAPGLAADPRLAFASVFADVDYRDAPGNTRAGGHYRAAITRYTDRGDGPYNFTRIDAEIVQVVPFFHKKRNIAFRAVLSDARGDEAADRVPFYMLPAIGGSNSLRGYRDYRFRDHTAILLTAEYRWEAFSGLDLALFADAGHVAPERRQLALDQLDTSFGLGFRFNTNRSVFLRLDAAFGGREGARFYLKFGPAF